MNIVVLAENWPPRIGGIENYLTHLAGHLPANSVTVFAPSARGASTLLPGHGIRQVVRTRFYWSGIRPRWLPLFITMWRYARREPIDVLICGKALFEGLVGYYLSKYLHIPYVVCTYGMEIGTWAAAPRHRRALERVLKSAVRITYINDETLVLLQQLGATSRQLVKIWPGVDERFLTPAELTPAVRTQYHVGSSYILAVARLVPRKGLDQLIEAFSQLEQTRFASTKLVIVGAGPELPVLQTLSQQLFVGSSVLFLGEVPDRDLPALYAGAEFFVLTPRPLGADIEGFGIVYLEAAGQGKAAIASRTGGAPEAVIDNETGLVISPNSVPALVAALTKLLSDTNLRTKLGTAAAERAHDQFRWSKRALLVKGMIDAIISERALAHRAQIVAK